VDSAQAFDYVSVIRCLLWRKARISKVEIVIERKSDEDNFLFTCATEGFLR
jgi:hypothetical protein